MAFFPAANFFFETIFPVFVFIRSDFVCPVVLTFCRVPRHTWPRVPRTETRFFRRRRRTVLRRLVRRRRVTRRLRVLRRRVVRRRRVVLRRAAIGFECVVEKLKKNRLK